MIKTASVKKVVLPSGTKLRRLPFGQGRGLRMEIDFGHQTRLYLGLYETELNRHLRRLCRSACAAFDLGGQSGYDALVMGKLTGGRVISVDCDPVAIEHMSRNFAANPSLAGSLVPYQALIGARTDTDLGMLSIDDLSQQFFVPDVVKIDIEGGEADAIRGAEGLLVHRRPALIIEVHSTDIEAECLELLNANGYHPLIVNQRRWLADYRPIEHNRWIVAMGRR